MLTGTETDGRTGLARLAMAAPPLPGTLSGISELLDRPESVDIDRVTRLVRHDPIVVARLLKIANSAHYGMQRTVASAHRAVDLLGPVTVTGIVLGMGLLRLPSPVESAAAGCFMRLVRHGMATARFAREIARRTGMSSDAAETAFTAGLVHDLGRLLLAYHEPETAAALYDRVDLLRADGEDGVLEAEQLAFGYDHTEVGEFVGRKFDFPDLLVDSMRYHHHGEAVPAVHETHDLVAVTACANLAASALGFPSTSEIAWSDAAHHPAWGLLPGRVDGARLRDDLESLTTDITGVVDTLLAWPLPPTAA